MGPVEPDKGIRKGPLEDPKPGEPGYKPGQSGHPEKEKPAEEGDKGDKEGEKKEGAGKGLTDDQLKQAMKEFSEMQDMIATPQVKDMAALRGFLSQLEGISMAQLALGLLLKGGGGGGGGAKGGGKEGQEKEKPDKETGKDERGGYPRR